MKFKNTSNKIINIGKTSVLPGEETSITEAVAELPAVKAYVAMGYATVEKERKAPPKAEKKPEPAVENETAEEAETPAEETEEVKPKRTYNKKKKAEEAE